MKKPVILVSFLFTIISLHTISYSREGFKEAGFVIIHSSKDYESAKKIVEEAHIRMNYKINLRGYYKGNDQPLETDKLCECGNNPHQYIARGRWDDGNYISIEHSDRYTGFIESYYIVVIASGQEDSKKLKEALALAKQFYPSAYLKKIEIYIGCILMWSCKNRHTVKQPVIE